MPAIANIQSNTQSLLHLLQSTKEGKTQLPDFQRSWVWKNEQIRKLISQRFSFVSNWGSYDAKDW